LAVQSYQTGSCFGGGVLCSGVFHDQYSDGTTASGVWLTVRTSPGQSGTYQALDMWWYVYVVCAACCSGHVAGD
jgi:hypothetical protein